MSTIVTMTLDEVKKMPPLSDERLKEILDFQDTENPDSPVPTKEQLREFRPWYEETAVSEGMTALISYACSGHSIYSPDTFIKNLSFLL